MKKLTGLFLLGTAFALVLAFAIPGKANAFVYGTNDCLILADGVDISIGGGGMGIDIDKGRADRDESYDQRRDYERDKEFNRDNENRRDRERDRERREADHHDND
jgi:hypothetical protein